MSKAKFRWLGAGILLFSLWLCGRYDITGIPLLLMTVGFAAGFEYLIVRPAGRHASTQARQAQPGNQGAAAQKDGP